MGGISAEMSEVVAPEREDAHHSKEEDVRERDEEAVPPEAVLVAVHTAWSSQGYEHGSTGEAVPGGYRLQYFRQLEGQPEARILTTASEHPQIHITQVQFSHPLPPVEA